MDNTQPLAAATTQDIQLELIGRRRFNQFDGPKVIASLEKHKGLWKSVFMSMPQTAIGDRELSWLCLRPLLSMLRNHWQADTLFVLCDSQSDAEQLLDIARAEEWEFGADDVLSGKTLSDAVGIYPFDGYVLRLWWD